MGLTCYLKLLFYLRCPPGVKGARCQYTGEPCPNGTLPCLDQANTCVATDLTCDGRNDCPNGLDESQSSCCFFKHKGKGCGEGKSQ